MSLYGRGGLLDSTVALVLAGGRGDRLLPLTRERTKAAVPFGGMFRLIDFTLSNCVHTGLRQIAVLPQYKFASLERHLRERWSFFRHEMGHSLTLLPPQQRVNGDWYRGTADAVYQNFHTLEQVRPRYTLILSSDHVYQMDYGRLIEYHASSGAELTVACVEVDFDQASQFGILDVDLEDRVLGFEEKPRDPWNMTARSGRPLASMGVYIFDTETLIDALTEDASREESLHDFGHTIIPRLIEERWKVMSYNVGERESDLYWRDIGTVDDYWETSMELLAPDPPIDLHDPEWSVPGCERSLPVRIVGERGVTWMGPRATLMEDSLVYRSILSPGVVVDHEAEVIDSVLMDGVHVGPGARISRAVVDKNVRVPAGCRIGVNLERSNGSFDVTPNGVMVVPKNAELSTPGMEAEGAQAFYGNEPLQQRESRATSDLDR